MDIKTKFNIGDTVFTMHSNSVLKAKVRSIKVYAFKVQNASEIKARITYDITGDNGVTHERQEHLLFPSKDKLVTSL